MSRITTFRLLLVASWVIPLLLWQVDVARYMARPHATRLVLGPPVTEVRLVLDQLAVWLGWVALLAGVLATGGLWLFRLWAIYVFAAGVAAYAGYVGIWDYFEFRFLPQLALLVHGFALGCVALWLGVARHSLPFPVNPKGRLTSA